MAGWQYIPRDDPVAFEGARAGYRYGYGQQPMYYPPPPFDQGPAVQFPRATGQQRMPIGPQQPPILINNINGEDNPIRGRQLGPGYPSPERKGSASRGRSRPREESSHRIWQQDQDNKQLRIELEAYRREKQRIEDERRITDEFALRKAQEEQRAREEEDRRRRIEKQATDEILAKKAREEQRAREEEERRQQIEKRAIEDYQQKERARILKERIDREEAEKRRRELEVQAVLDYQRREREKLEREKAEKQQREEEFKARVKRDLKLSDEELAKLRDRDHTNVRIIDQKRKTYTKIARKHISIETLRAFSLPYKLDDVRPSVPSFGFSASPVTQTWTVMATDLLFG